MVSAAVSTAKSVNGEAQNATANQSGRLFAMSPVFMEVSLCYHQQLCQQTNRKLGLLAKSLPETLTAGACAQGACRS